MELLAGVRRRTVTECHLRLRLAALEPRANTSGKIIAPSRADRIASVARSRCPVAAQFLCHGDGGANAVS